MAARLLFVYGPHRDRGKSVLGLHGNYSFYQTAIPAAQTDYWMDQASGYIRALFGRAG